MPREHGFSLIELMIALAVLAILIGMAGPSFARLAGSTRAGNAMSHLTVAFATARIEAVRRGRPVTVCPTDAPNRCRTDGIWDGGWIVFDDAQRTAQPADESAVLQRFDALPSGLALQATQGRPYVRFQPSGWSAGSNVSVRLCDRAARQLVGAVVVNNAGRARTERFETAAPCPYIR